MEDNSISDKKLIQNKSRPCLAPGGFQPKPYHN